MTNPPEPTELPPTEVRQPNSLDRYKATLEHVNHVKALENCISSLKIREAYLISVLKAVHHEEQEMDCLTSHCRDLVANAVNSVHSETGKDFEQAWRALQRAENCRKCEPHVHEVMILLERFRGNA